MNEYFETRAQKARRKLNFNYIEPINPLLKLLIFGELIEYLTVPGKDSYSTLQNVRLVCHQWNHLISRKFQLRSIITATPDKNLAQLSITFQTSCKESEQIKMTSLRISDAEWFEMYLLFHWIHVYGQKLIGLELEGIQLTVKNLVNLLKGCPNLENVALTDLTIHHEAHDMSDLVHNTRQFHFKHLTIKRGIRSLALENPGHVEELAKYALVGLPPLESLNLYLTPGSCHLIAFLSTNPLGRDTVAILNNLKRLDLWNVYRPAAAYNLNSCGVHFRNLKELEIEISDLENLQVLLDCTTSTLEKLVWNCIYSSNTDSTHRELPNLKEFVFRYLDISEHGSPDQTFIDRFINRFPALRSWSCEAFNWDPRHQLSKSTCESAECNHVDLMLTTGEVNFRKNNLKKLQLFCSLKKVKDVSQIINVFPDLKELSLWIHSTSLNKYFAILKNLQQLKFLTIYLSQSIIDLSFAINFYLPDLFSTCGHCIS